jgi:hypothetical protein
MNQSRIAEATQPAIQRQASKRAIGCPEDQAAGGEVGGTAELAQPAFACDDQQQHNKTQQPPIRATKQPRGQSNPRAARGCASKTLDSRPDKVRSQVPDAICGLLRLVTK